MDPSSIEFEEIVQECLYWDQYGHAGKGYVFNRLKETHFKDLDVEKCSRIWAEQFHRFQMPMEGSYETLKKLKGKYRLGILSNGDSVFKFEVYPESTVFKFSSDTKVGENLDKLIQSINDEYPKLTSTWTYDNIEGGILVKYPEGNAEYVKTYLEEELQASFPSLTIASGSYGERVLTALWEPSVYSITYDRNGIVYTSGRRKSFCVGL